MGEKIGDEMGDLPFWNQVSKTIVDKISDRLFWNERQSSAKNSAKKMRMQDSCE